MPYLPYHEPGITVLLSLTSFLLLLNVARYILDHLLYCGLIGEILLGIVYGLPVGGTSWLSLGTQETIQALGYLGLIGLVFEGGLNTDLALLKQTAYASVSVATIGLIMPIALSFILLLLPFSSNSGGLSAYPTPLAAFSAGASLCSTSLGTTFAILSSAGMQQTRVGVVLVGAAIMDDVVGLVMVNIVTTLGSGSVGGWPIARPIVASFGLFLMTMVLCPYAIKPVWVWTLNFVNLGSQLHQDENPTFLATIRRTLHGLPHTIFVLSIVVLVIYVTIASFTGASVLFAAFIAGGVVNYLWETQLQEPTLPNKGPVSMYEKYFKPIFDYMLVPFFFLIEPMSYSVSFQASYSSMVLKASIGFSIPITNMFEASIIWKGILYAALMTVAKSLTATVIYFDYFNSSVKAQCQTESSNQPPSDLNSNTNAPAQTPPHSIAFLVGMAMVARGEIGFLIASLSQSSRVFILQVRTSNLQPEDEQIFLVVVWSVVLCTIIGPIGVGLIVRRLRQRNDCVQQSKWTRE